MADVQASSYDTIPVVRFLQKGQIVHVYGIPVRLTQGVDVETSQGNVKLIDEREIGVTLADQLRKVPALAGTEHNAPRSNSLVNPPTIAPPKGESNPVIEYMKRLAEEHRDQQKRAPRQIPESWDVPVQLPAYVWQVSSPQFVPTPFKLPFEITSGPDVTPLSEK